MKRFSFSLDETGITIKIAEEKKTLLGLFRNHKRPDLDEMSTSDRQFAIALAKLKALDLEQQHYRCDNDCLFIDHWLLSQIDDFSAMALELPDRLTGISFHAEMKGNIGSPRFAFDWWWEKDGRCIQLNRTGAIVHSGSKKMRLPAPIYDAIQIAGSFDSTAPLPEHWKALAEFRNLMGMSDRAISTPEGFLERVEIKSCSRIGMSFDEQDPLAFAPVPFSNKQSDDGAKASSENVVLEDSKLSIFQQETKRRGAQPAYSLGENQYLILDRSAMPIVDTITNYASASNEEKKFFLQNAEQLISEAIERALRDDGKLNDSMQADDQSHLVEQAFSAAWVETPEYASRVIEVRQWTKPEIEVLEGSGTQWLPGEIEDALGIILGTIPDDELDQVIENVRQAISQQKSVVSTDYGDLPALPLVLEALTRRLEQYLWRQDKDSPESDVTAYLPVTHDNFWELEFKDRLRKRPDNVSTELPSTVVQQLRPYQQSAFNWQVNAWQTGLPGILNADEQGLGKTLQTLSFLAWLSNVHEQQDNNNPPPILIVAPTTLLRNWEAEIDAHLAPDTFGIPVRLYGPELSSWKKQNTRGRDIQDGQSRLNLEELYVGNRIRLAITTYQTLANYAVSFAEFPFSAVIFDEIQNLKNPVTLRSNAAKALNAEFRIGLTGTPVENATQDIWAIMDQLFPGALGSLSDFRVAFDKPTPAKMQALNKAIFNSNGGYPSLGIRRVKKDVAHDLPPKTRILHPRLMPPIQALRYDEARRPGQTMFGLLHHIRRTSLHPGLIEGESLDQFTQSSARVTAAIDILKHIKAKNERALVFIENLDVQVWLSELIKIEFGLPRVDIINGQTPISRRHEITRRFQRHLVKDEGFDVLVMGPRAAGTGLTLTAANHVVHLTRWWNPAVEEQCNDRTHRIGQKQPVTIHIPLAIHPSLQRNSFDCLLQTLMHKKRSIADSVLWPGESEENELLGLYQTVIGPDSTVGVDKPIGLNLAVEDYPDLVCDKLENNTVRLRPTKGGATVVISTKEDELSMIKLVDSDAAIISMTDADQISVDPGIPHSKLKDMRLWPEYVLPD